MQKKDFEKITVTEIVKLSGLNRGTFYAHYSNVVDVLEEIEREVTDKILSLFSSYKSQIIENPASFFTRHSGVFAKRL